jgi:hypothetical protein
MRYFRFEHPEYIFENTWRDTQHRYAENSVFVDLPGYTLPLSRWTTISNDDTFLSRLLLLFWTWDTISNRVIDRTMFEEDLKTLDPTMPNQPNELRFCSSFLVNALLAVSCVSVPIWPPVKCRLTRILGVYEEPSDLSPAERCKHPRPGFCQRSGKAIAFRRHQPIFGGSTGSGIDEHLRGSSGQWGDSIELP